MKPCTHCGAPRRVVGAEACSYCEVLYAEPSVRDGLALRLLDAGMITAQTYASVSLDMPVIREWVGHSPLRIHYA